MVSLKHNTKKVINRASTSKKALNQGINAEYLDCRRRLQDISSVTRTLLKSVYATRESWTGVARHQRDFAKTLAAAFPSPGEVQAQAFEVESKIRTVQECLNDDDGPDAAHRRMAAVLEEYLELLNSLEREYGSVEMAYTESTRYERKVDKLEKKASKKQDALQRNLEKLSSARSEYDAKVKALLVRMREAFGKHEAVLQCAHHAFWMANQTYSSTIDNLTRSIRAESVAVHRHLLNIDVQGPNELLPVPRVPMISNEPTPLDVPTSPISTEGSEDGMTTAQEQKVFHDPATPAPSLVEAAL